MDTDASVPELPIDTRDDDDHAVFECWCGERGTYDELFDASGLDATCGGGGMLHCICGGDFCVCHHHGETVCPGCVDCDDGDDSHFGGSDFSDDQ